MNEKGKFLVEFLSGFSHHQLFFAFWFIIVSFFVLLIIAYYRKTGRRNFRSPGDLKSTSIHKVSQDLVPKRGKAHIGVRSSHPSQPQATGKGKEITGGD